MQGDAANRYTQSVRRISETRVPIVLYSRPDSEIILFVAYRHLRHQKPSCFSTQKMKIAEC